MIRKINDIDLKLLGSGNDSATTSGKFTPVKLKTVLVLANTIKPYDTIRVRALFRKETTLNSPFIIYLYWNTSDSLTGAIQIATYTVGGTTPSPCLYRTIHFRNNNTVDIMSTTFSSFVDTGDFITNVNNIAVQYTVDGYYMAAAVCTGINRIEDAILCSYLTVEL